MKTWLIKYRTLCTLVAALLLWSVIFYLIPAEVIIERIGIQHAYIVSFVISLVACFSTFTGASAYAAVAEFSRGGANPLILGVTSGIGLFLSDSAFYLLAMYGRTTIENRFRGFFKKFQTIFEKLPTPAVYALVYIFCSIGPIPNDVILTLLVVGGYTYWKFWPIILAGDMTFMLFLSHAFQQ